MNKVPGLLFSGPPWDHNFYEFLVNTMMPAFQTAVMTGLLDLGEWTSERHCTAPSVQNR